MLDRDLSPKHCPRCGHKLGRRQLKDNEPQRLVCIACGFVFYLDPKLAVCALIAVDGRLVLGRRTIEPGRGLWVLPGGFVDRGEAVPRALEREVLEETGLEVETGPLWGLYSYPGQTVVVAVYQVRIVGGQLYAGDETSEVGLFLPEEIPWPELAFQSTADALQEYVRRDQGADR
ncbi:MAG: NUDIX hydrolase [Deltaproteobacteria bacterium]|nr:NUDIX hydrolase [Deltaproteobacteria bacterium]